MIIKKCPQCGRGLFPEKFEIIDSTIFEEILKLPPRQSNLIEDKEMYTGKKKYILPDRIPIDKDRERWMEDIESKFRRLNCCGHRVWIVKTYLNFDIETYENEEKGGWEIK